MAHVLVLPAGGVLALQERVVVLDGRREALSETHARVLEATLPPGVAHPLAQVSRAVWPRLGDHELGSGRARLRTAVSEIRKRLDRERGAFVTDRVGGHLTLHAILLQVPEPVDAEVVYFARATACDALSAPAPNVLAAIIAGKERLFHPVWAMSIECDRSRSH